MTLARMLRLRDRPSGTPYVAWKLALTYTESDMAIMIHSVWSGRGDD